MRSSSCFLVLASLIGGVALFSSHHADAQSFQKGDFQKGAVFNPKPAPPATPLRTNLANLSTEVSGGGTVNVATNGSLQGIPVLNGFHYRFGNGDHKFQRIGLRPTGDQTAYVTYRDKNGDDKYKVQATWNTLQGGGVEGEVSAKIWQQSFVKLPLAKPANSRLVLSGFELRYPDGKDYNVRMIGIWLDEATNMARVSFIDGDFAPLLGTAGPGYRVAREAKILPQLDLDRVSGSLSKDGKPGDWVWEKDTWTSSSPEAAVRIQYAWIPNDATLPGEQILTGTGRAPDSGAQFPAKSGIQGFEFRFDSGGDHHLLQIGILPPMPGAVTRSQSGVAANEFIQFQDKNRDDAIRWAVRTVTLK